MCSHFLFSGPKYLYLLGIYNKRDRTPPHTTTLTHQHTGILHAPTACEQKVMAPPCAFPDLPKSLCSLPPSFCSPETRGKCRAWWEEKDGSVLTVTFVARCIPGFFTWRTKTMVLTFLTSSNSMFATSHDQPSSHLSANKIQEARIIIHLSLCNEYLLTYYL